MSTQRFEAPTLELAAARVRAELGPDARLVSATKVRTGGLGGWFAREKVEVEVIVDDAATAVVADADGEVAVHDEPVAAGVPLAGPRHAARGRHAPGEPARRGEATSTPAPASPAEAGFVAALGAAGAEPPDDEGPVRAVLEAMARQAPSSVIDLADLVDDAPAATFTARAATAPAAGRPVAPAVASGAGPVAVGADDDQANSLAAAARVAAAATGAAERIAAATAPLASGTARVPAATVAIAAATHDLPVAAAAAAPDDAGARFSRLITRLATEHLAKTASAAPAIPPAAATSALAAPASAPMAPPAPLEAPPVPVSPAQPVPTSQAQPVPPPHAQPSAPAQALAPAPPTPTPMPAPVPVPTRPARAGALESAGDAAGVARHLGVPGAPSAEALVEPRSLAAWQADFASLLCDLPSPGPLPTSPGAVLAVVGRPAEAALVAASLAKAMGTDPDEVVVAAATQTLRTAPTQLRAPEHAGDFRRSLRWRDRPVVVVVEADVRPAGDAWARDMLAALAPAQCWAVLDATRKTEDVVAWSHALGGFDALAVARTGETATPASVLAADIPVGMLDGATATAERWADVLCAHLPESLVTD